jgi:hypothetical protein
MNRTGLFPEVAIGSFRRKSNNTFSPISKKPSELSGNMWVSIFVKEAKILPTLSQDIWLLLTSAIAEMIVSGVGRSSKK